MKFILFISDFIIPLLFFYIIAYGLILKINIFDEFIKGAKDGFSVIYHIAPTLIGLMVAVGVLRASGGLEFMSSLFSPIADIFHIPKVIIPASIVKIFSSSAATGLVLDIFKEYGPDSLEGTMISIIMSCTETIFYTMSVYFMTVRIKKTRYTLSGGLIAMLAGIIASVVLTNML